MPRAFSGTPQALTIEDYNLLHARNNTARARDYYLKDNERQLGCQLLSISGDFLITKIRFATKIYKNRRTHFSFAQMNAACCIGGQN